MSVAAAPAPAPTAARPALLPALTGLRFLAALAVLVFHFSAPVRDRFPSPLRLWARNGYLGVALFFILSGFVLAYNYFPQARAGAFHRGRFWHARFARIYPVYAGALVLGAVAIALRDHLSLWSAHSLASWLLNLTMIQSFFPAPFNAWNLPAWTLSVEAVFYLLFPLAVPLHRLRRKGAAAACAALAVCILAVFPLSSDYGHWFSPLLYLPLFALGMLLARLHELGIHPHPRLWPLAGLAVLLVMAWNPPLPRLYPISALLCGALILGLASARRSWLSTRPLRVLGEASYGLYILQMPVWLFLGHFWTSAIRRGWLPPAWHTSTMVFFAANLACAIALSLVSYYCLERPARGYLRRKLAA
ncbi:MAG TPA: acyltransferase [Terriglobales bacterium]